MKSIMAKPSLKIVFCMSRLYGAVSGSDNLMISYARQLQQRGHRPSVLLVSPDLIDDPYYRCLQQARVEFSCISQQSLIGPLLQAIDLRRKWRCVERLMPWPSWQQLVFVGAWYHFKRHVPDAVHILQPSDGIPEIIQAACKVQVPVLYHEQRTPWDMVESEPELETWYAGITPFLSMCSTIAALSPRLAEICRQRFAYRGRISVLPIIVPKPATGVMIEKLSLRTPAQLTFGYASLLYHLKGPCLLLEAFANVLGRFPEARLRMAGKGPGGNESIHEQEVHERARQLNLRENCEFTYFLGPVERTRFFYSLDVFVHPSLSEGTPNSIVEAMAHGLPVVACAVGGIPDIVTPETGILVEPGDAAALAEALSGLAADPELRMRMGRAARQRYEELFSPEAVAPLLLETYHNVARVRRPVGVQADDRLPTHPWAIAQTDPSD